MDLHTYPDDTVRAIYLTNTTALFEDGRHVYVDFCHALELVLILLTSVSSLVTFYFGCTIRAAHCNLITILNLYEIMYFPFATARVVLILVERGLFTFTGDLSHDTPLLYCGFIQGWFLMTHAVKIPAMLCERLFASWFIGDYEKLRRLWISTTLMVLILSSSFIMTLLTFCNTFRSYFTCVVPAFVLQVFSIMIAFRIRYTNKKMDKLLASKVDYTLSRKFQHAENWKILRLIRTKIVTTIVIVIVSCCMFSLVMTLEEDPVLQARVSMILQLCFSGFPLIINITTIYSFETWREKFIPMRRESRTPKISQQQMSDIHFQQIENAWK